MFKLQSPTAAKHDPQFQQMFTLLLHQVYSRPLEAFDASQHSTRYWPRSFAPSHAGDDCGVGSAATLTNGLQAHLGLPPPQFRDEGRHQLGASAA